MKKLLSALVMLALCSSVAMANIPDPTKCDVDPADALQGVVLAPDSPSPIPASIYTVTVRNTFNDPIPNSTVVFELDPNIDLCTTANHQGVTNGAGQVVITLRGGGCVEGAGAAIVKASGITIAEYANAKSPDWDGAQGDGVVNLADLITFTGGPSCHDYNNDGVVNLSDVITFSFAYVPQHTCTLQ